jgi:hypothetical protein
MRYRGFWREFLSRDNSMVDTMAVISLIISAPIVALAGVSLIYDIFYLGFGLTEVSVKLFSVLILAATGGLAASRFSKRTAAEMAGRVLAEEDKTPPAKPARPQGD